MKVLDLGRKGYAETWELQKALVDQRAAGEIEDTLVLVEHDPVYTLGRAAEPPAEGSIKVPKLGSVSVVEVERGGKLTFHGPGQLVGYPIFELRDRDLRLYLRNVERVLVDSIRTATMLPASPSPETLLLEPGQLQTGVWIRDKKIASIGIAVRKWVTYHGFALNLSTDLRYFQAVDPCGFNGSIMTTVQNEMGPAADIRQISARITEKLVEGFSSLSQ